MKDYSIFRYTKGARMVYTVLEDSNDIPGFDDILQDTPCYDNLELSMQIGRLHGSGKITKETAEDLIGQIKETCSNFCYQCWLREK